MKNTLILIFAMLFLSCQKQNQFEKNLIDDSQTTFWARKAKDTSGNFNYFGIQMVFNKDNTSEGFCSDDENIKGKYCAIMLDLPNEKKSKDWSFNEEDSLFFMSPDMYKISRYSKDTIYMNLLTGKKEQFIMIRKKIK